MKINSKGCLQLVLVCRDHPEVAAGWHLNHSSSLTFELVKIFGSEDESKWCWKYLNRSVLRMDRSAQVKKKIATLRMSREKKKDAQRF